VLLLSCSVIFAEGGGKKPAWIDKPGSVFNDAVYVSAVGSASDAETADANAFANLTGFFGKSVKSDFSAIETYRERLNNTSIELDVGQNTVISASMDSLIGAKIGERWYDKSKKVYYAIAIMEKSDAIKIYSNIVTSNIKLINEIIAAPNNNDFDTVARFQTAADIADANEIFITVLSMLGDNRKYANTNGKDYRYEALKTAKQISVNIAVKNDENNEISAAFTDVFTSEGFKTGVGRYKLNASITLTPLNLNTENKFTRYTVDASLIDTNDNSVLITYNITGREGHLSQAEANTRAIRSAADKIKEEYAKKLQDYFLKK
jgi:hypothetical protein